MTGSIIDHPCDVLHEVSQATSAIAHLIDLAALRPADAMSGNDLHGLSVILRWIGERVADAMEAVTNRLDASETAALRSVGMPEAAFGDERLRRSWRDGFAHGLSHAAKEDAQ